VTLPKAISDAIDAHESMVREHGSGGSEADTRASLERAIAEHVAPVAEPNEAEIEDWKAGALLDGKVTRYVPESAAATPAASWDGGPTVTAMMRGVEDAAIEWGKCVGDYNAACQAAPPPSGLEASEAVRKAGHKCELAYGYFQKAIKALADHRATPALPALERLRERVQNFVSLLIWSESSAALHTMLDPLRMMLDWIDEERERPSET
jgi:hypothetical protein